MNFNLTHSSSILPTSPQALLLWLLLALLTMSLLIITSFLKVLTLILPVFIVFQILHTLLFNDPLPPGTNSVAAPGLSDQAISVFNVLFIPSSYTDEDVPVLPDMEPKSGTFLPPPSPLLLEADGDIESVPHLRPGLCCCGHT